MLTSVYETSPFLLSPLASFAYDSVLSLAVMLNKTLEIVESGMVEPTGCQDRNGMLTSLENFTFDNDLMGCIFLNSLMNANFTGLTVSVDNS